MTDLQEARIAARIIKLERKINQVGEAIISIITYAEIIYLT